MSVSLIDDGSGSSSVVMMSLPPTNLNFLWGNSRHARPGYSACFKSDVLAAYGVEAPCGTLGGSCEGTILQSVMIGSLAVSEEQELRHIIDTAETSEATNLTFSSASILSVIPHGLSKDNATLSAFGVARRLPVMSPGGVWPVANNWVSYLAPTFFDAIHLSTCCSITSSGTRPIPRIRLWYSFTENPSPRDFRARSRNSTIFNSPTM